MGKVEDLVVKIEAKGLKVTLGLYNTMMNQNAFISFTSYMQINNRSFNYNTTLSIFICIIVILKLMLLFSSSSSYKVPKC
jgi:hypothetical protein